jgi:hypothetical protein
MQHTYQEQQKDYLQQDDAGVDGRYSNLGSSRERSNFKSYGTIPGGANTSRITIERKESSDN